MSGVKRAVLDLVKKLPADCTFEDIQYQLYVRQKIERDPSNAEILVTENGGYKIVP